MNRSNIFHRLHRGRGDGVWKNSGMRLQKQCHIPALPTAQPHIWCGFQQQLVDTVHVSVSVNKAHEITLVYLLVQDDSARYIHPCDVYNNPKIYLYVLFCIRLTLGNSSRASATPLLFAKNTFIIHQKWGTRVIKTNRAADPLPPAITALTLLLPCPQTDPQQHTHE